MKRCTVCGEIKPLDDYFRDKRASDGRYSSCKPCQREKTLRWRTENAAKHHATQKRWREAHPEIVSRVHKNWYSRNRHGPWLKFRYGISLDDYRRKLAEQGGGCAVCGSKTYSPKCERMLCVDHDHGSGMIRGLLCNACNRGLGNFRDDAALLVSAANYLRRHGVEALEDAG